MAHLSFVKYFRKTFSTRVRVTQRRRVGGLGGSHKTYLSNKEEARILVLRKLVELNEHYHFVYNRVSIRNQRSRWGSCSKKGNLNFNYRIVELSDELQDYIIVHELCHLGMFNHSKKFWELVAQKIPDHIGARKALREHVTKKVSIS